MLWARRPEAIRLADSSRGPWTDDADVDALCEKLLLLSGAAEEALAVDAALDRLAADSPRAARVVELRIFGGLTLDEIATVLDVSAKTVQRDWEAARAWLRKEIRGELPGAGDVRDAARKSP